MKTFVLLLCLAAPAALGHPSLVVTSQFQAQDALGQYNYGYSGDSSAKQEIQTHDGVTRGSFSYVDGNGHVQSRSYVADDVHGFRVAATDLPVGPVPVVAASPVLISAPIGPHAGLLSLGGPHPVHDTPEVVAAKIAHAHAHAEALARSHGRRRRSVSLYPGGAYAWSAQQVLTAPVLVSAHAVAAPVLAAPHVVAAPHSSVLVAGPADPSAAIVGPTSASASLAGPDGNGVIAAHSSSSGSVVKAHGTTVLTPPVHGPAVVAGPAAPHAVVAGPAAAHSVVAGHVGAIPVLGLGHGHVQGVLETPEVISARIAHAQAYAEVQARDHGLYRRRRSLGGAVVVGPSAPETILKGPGGAGLVISPATPGGTVLTGHGATAVIAPAAPAVVLGAPVAHGPVAHAVYAHSDGSDLGQYSYDDYSDGHSDY